ncbi:MAG TPA: GatB/YqeY domain-containing protein [Ilumatobacteraceae bacterium]|nr:GatB/YqeY domain-containing protein [Ilumatobacteraceae bacterium]HRB03000.1 GatB/YqeY domain-containing protein [Ilumatobacteraceae bacterium]
MSETDVKSRLRAAMTAAMKTREELALGALRQTLSEIAVVETAGDEVAVLSDEQVLAVIAIEVRKHHETADAFVTAGRAEQAARSRAEAAVLEAYLPAALSDDELHQIIGEEVAAASAAGAEGMKAMGRVVAAVRAKAGPTADGAKIAAAVKAALA